MENPCCKDMENIENADIIGKMREGILMKKIESYIIFFIGVVFVALSIALFVKAALGTTPIASAAYVLSLALPYSIGFFNFIVSALVFLLQIAILGRKFPLYQWLQIPVAVIFCAGIDVWMALLTWLVPASYAAQFVVLLLGCLSMGIGVTLEVKGGVIMLPCEAFVNTVCTVWHFRFGNVKILFDASLVALAAVISLYYFGDIRGIREGTLLSAFSTGFLEKCFTIYIPGWERKWGIITKG